VNLNDLSWTGANWAQSRPQRASADDLRAGWLRPVVVEIPASCVTTGASTNFSGGVESRHAAPSDGLQREPAKAESFKHAANTVSRSSARPAEYLNAWPEVGSPSTSAPHVNWMGQPCVLLISGITHPTRGVAATVKWSNPEMRINRHAGIRQAGSVESFAGRGRLQLHPNVENPSLAVTFAGMAGKTGYGIAQDNRQVPRPTSQ